MIGWLFAGRRERVRRQAADWIAQLNGPHDERDRAAFAQWYHADPDHAAAFDRQSALFHLAEGIRPVPDTGYTEPPAARRQHPWPGRYAFAAAAAAALVVVLAFTLLAARDTVPSTQGEVQVVVFAATGSEARRVHLVDGSQVVLEPGSALAVKIDDAERWLQLERGEGRFTVFRDARPFIVTAAGTEIVAHGTQFIVRLGYEGTLVSLIEGRIDVSYPPSADRAKRRVASLTPGQQVIVPDLRAPVTAPKVSAEADPRPAMIEFDDTRLAEAVDEVNRHAARPIRLADPALAELRVTGAFRAGDAEGFAESVAAALGLEVERGRDGSLWLRRPRAAAGR
jgi:transmembrane sensor